MKYNRLNYFDRRVGRQRHCKARAPQGLRERLVLVSPGRGVADRAEVAVDAIATHHAGVRPVVYGKPWELGVD